MHLARSVVAIAFVFLSSVASSAEWGDLVGTFVFDGEPPKPAKLDVNKDLECCGKFLDILVDESVSVGPTGGLKNVFVYLKSSPGKKVTIHPDLAQAAQPVVLDNVKCRFEPHALALWAGNQTLLVTNSDPIGHAAKMDFLKNAPVNSLLPAGAKQEFKLQNGEALPTRVACGVHPWESAFLKVHDSPYFAVSDENGRFTIPKLPVGEWEFQIWHEKTGYLAAKPEWTRGRFKFKIAAGENDLGTIKTAASLFDKK
ncbi:MAG: hypothetical protein U0795_05210 [Pirellulales bacterium]